MGKHQDVAGILLAGGRSRRMGNDKRFLELGGTTLFQRALSVIEAIFSEIYIVVADPLPQDVQVDPPVVTDLIPNCAALGGLYTGLFFSHSPRVFVVACDMPFLNPLVIRKMAELSPAADIVMAKLPSGLQPMHAFYSKRCLPYLEAMAKENNLKLQELADHQDLSVRLVGEQEIGESDCPMLSFMNVNTPADFEFARKLLSKH